MSAHQEYFAQQDSSHHDAESSRPNLVRGTEYQVGKAVHEVPVLYQSEQGGWVMKEKISLIARDQVIFQGTAQERAINGVDPNHLIFTLSPQVLSRYRSFFPESGIIVLTSSDCNLMKLPPPK